MRYYSLMTLVILGSGCVQSAKHEATKTAASPPIAGLPVTVTLKQRSNQVIPGSDGVRLTIDDVTRGQVMTSLAAKDGATLLAPISLTPGHSAEFKVGGVPFTITLKDLNNALIDEDYATFVISIPAGAGLSEKEKIERLIGHVEQLHGATFVRNGNDHSAKEAAGHLRTKWEAAGDRVTTARQFIEHVATKSSTSGDPYLIKFRDGNTRPAGQYFHEQLAAMEGKIAGRK